MSFINPLFLIATSAALLPVLYHLVRRIKAKKVPFSSLMFLRETPKELVRRRRLKDLLLMAMRAAMFALLALAFARPYVPPDAIPFGGPREDRSVVLLVDRSMSMRHGDRFADALAEVRARLAEAGPRDEIAVVAFADDARTLAALSTDRAVAEQVVAGLEPGYRPTDFYRALRLAEEVLQGARHDDRRVVLVSDFQDGGFDGAFDNWKLRDDLAFEPVAVGTGEAENRFVEAVELGQRRRGADVALRFEARLAGPDEAELAADLTVDGEREGPQRAPSGGRVSFQQIAPREGFFQGHVALAEADDLAADDRFYFTYEVEGRPRILGIDAGGRGAARDGFFLQNAFEMGEAALYAFEAATPQRLSPAGLRTADAVFVLNLNALTGAQTEALRAYAQDGGSVVFSFGARTNAAAFSETMQTFGLGTLGGVVDARGLQGTEAIIGEVDRRHPVFAGLGTSAILRPRFRRYLRLVPDSSTAVLARYDTGDPMLAERRLGRGRVLVYTATLNTAWTDFPVDEMYVPFVYQLAAHALGTGARTYGYRVGEPVRLPGDPGAVWEVRGPDDRVFRVEVDEGGRAFFRETEVPGHYVAASGRETVPFSVNVDVRESDLAVRDPDEVYAAVVPTSEAPTAADPAQAAALAVAEAERDQGLWRYLLLLVVALFAAETWLANRWTAAPRRRHTSVTT